MKNNSRLLRLMKTSDGRYVMPLSEISQRETTRLLCGEMEEDEQNKSVKRESFLKKSEEMSGM